MSVLEQELKDILDLRGPDAFPEDTDIVVIATTWIAEIGDFSVEVAKRYAKTDYDEAKALAKKYLTQFFDEVVIPYDFKAISEPWETMIEQSVRKQIEPLVDLAFDSFLKKSETTETE